VRFAQLDLICSYAGSQKPNLQDQVGVSLPRGQHVRMVVVEIHDQEEVARLERLRIRDLVDQHLDLGQIENPTDTLES